MKADDSPTARYLRALFRPGEFVCMSDDLLDTRLTPLAEACKQAPGSFVSLNPLIEGQSRKDIYTASHRNFLIEFDKITLEEQMAKLVELEVPYTTLVYSGGKSLHAVIALTEDVGGEAYAELFDLLSIVLWQTDKSTRNPSRFTRVGGAVRDNGAEQTLLEVRKRVRPEQLASWLARFSGHIERTLERRERAEVARAARLAELQASGATGMELVEERTRLFFAGELAPKGSRHARLVAGVFELFECGVEYEEALQLANQAADLYGITADRKRANEAEQVVNYVYGMRRSRRVSL